MSIHCYNPKKMYKLEFVYTRFDKICGVDAYNNICNFDLQLALVKGAKAYAQENCYVCHGKYYEVICELGKPKSYKLIETERLN